MITNFNCGVLYVSNEWEIPEIQPDAQSPAYIREGRHSIEDPNTIPVTVGGTSAETAAETAGTGMNRKSAVEYDISKGSEVRVNVQVLDES